MTARDHALAVLDAKSLPAWKPNLLKRKNLTPPVDPRDVALGEQIIQGTIKNLLLLQHLTAHHANRNPKSIDPLVQKIFAIALYQLRFLTRIPASAAVDEAVNQARRFGRTKAAGFVNAVLRNATRNPDPDLSPEIALSHPKELFNRLKSLLGPEDALRFCQHDQVEPPTILRLNPGHTLSTDVPATPHEQPNLYVLKTAKRPLLAQLAERGIAQVQDATAAAVVPKLDLHSGQQVLDRCAGLGTKTLQIRQAVGDAGQVHAIDANLHRTGTLRLLIAKREFTNVHVHQGSWLREVNVPGQFDRILIDAPCSNSGVLARRPEARYHQSSGALKSLEKLQDDILDDTAPVTKPAGLLLYSTCSVWPEENEHRARAFLQRHPDFELIEENSTLPSFTTDPTKYHDGGYYALLRKRG
jgi:16S rRNA (cytosine967-C5)-methyltransferase